ncbi:heme NO-binding domain-containing protein [Roseicyclus sp. F158]|uniref:Heme NO-binding domain-containing protein n=1 Tax=Tropicimonas omnivorans TaxID=3075590 RepID=A0ABU3DGM9_9RHOB|nr:heme NO-binding domain-containing protein [Roseicyclus sp. F158]MDT0682866.1 heme NO-binding domain-containing protein [Roseicyclus sp. F158]
MHGLINRAIQGFAVDTAGPDAWRRVAREADIDPNQPFMPLMVRNTPVTHRLLEATSRVLEKPAPVVLEDLGTWLVAGRGTAPIRRLLRFGGETFPDFLHSLEDLPGRARLAVSGLQLPTIRLGQGRDGRYTIAIDAPHGGYGYVLCGILRALADDYGTLALLDPPPEEPEDGAFGAGSFHLGLTLIDTTFAEARAFSLVGPERGE